MRAGGLTCILGLMAVFVLANRTLGGAFTDWAAALSFIALCVIGLKTGGVREALLFAAAVLLSVPLLANGNLPVLLEALDLAAYFAAFILLLTVLKIAADRSASVLEVGRFLIRQPASGRFLATASGGHVLGVFLNFAAISLMAPLIQNAAKRDDGTPDAALERRQLSALLRGFAWILLWAPTTLTQAVLLTLFTEIDLGKLIALGIGTAVLMMGIGFLTDRYEWRGMAAATGAPALPRRALLRLCAVCLTLIAATAALQIGAGLSTALSLMFAAPAITLVWYGAQNPGGEPLSRHLAGFWPALRGDALGLARSAIALGLSGFIGRVLASVLPMESLTAGLNLDALPGWTFLAALPVLITLGGQVALSPIILVVFIGQVVQMVPNLPAEPTHIVFALSAGWAISMFASPNATATLLISATTKVPPTRLTWGWNLRYGVLCYAVLVGLFILLEGL